MKLLTRRDRFTLRTNWINDAGGPGRALSFRAFCLYNIGPGYGRVDVSVDASVFVGNRVKISGYAAPDRSKAVVVLANTGLSNENVKIEWGVLRLWRPSRNCLA